MNSATLIITCAALAAMLLCYVVGFRRGKAVGWCEHHFDDIAKDRARRDRLGRFRTPTKGTP